MSKKRSHAFDHFVDATDEQRLKCLHCDDSITKKLFNLRRHLSRVHSKEFDAAMAQDTADYAAASAPKRAKTDSSTPSVAAFFKPTIKVSMTKLTFKLGIVDMVVRRGLSLVTFSSPGFLSLLGEMAKTVGVSLDRDSVRAMVLQEAAQMREQLRKEVRGRLVYVKMDAGTRHTKNYLGINIQFCGEDANGNLCNQIRTLAVVDTKGRHKSEDMNNMLSAALDSFEIEHGNVAAIIVDNANNMTKAVRLFNEQQEEAAAATAEQDDDEEDEGDSDDDGDDEEVDGGFLEQLEQVAVGDVAHHMRCALHTLQLAIKDGTKSRNLTNTLAKVRQVVRLLRAPNLLTVIRRRGGRSPILDAPTRWSSTYVMLERLLSLREIVDDLGTATKELYVSATMWEFIVDIANVLEQPYKVTIRLQAANLTPGEFLKEWEVLKSNLNNLGGAALSAIKDAMIAREKKLFDNNMFLAAVMVDARYRILLKEEYTERAKRGIKEVSMRIMRLRKVAESSAASSTSSSPRRSAADDEEDVFERQLDKLERQQVAEREAQTVPVDLDQEMIQMLGLGRLKAKTAYELIQRYPDNLRDAANTLTALSVPSVGRAAVLGAEVHSI